MSLKECPSCGHDAIFVPLVPAVGYDGTLYGSKSEGFCNGHKCDQLFWYYPRSGRITRRMVGRTLAEWRKQRVDLLIINIMRRHEGLPYLIEEPPREHVVHLTRPWSARLQDTIVNWFWYIVAAVKSPFIRKSPPGMLSGGQTINEVRAEQGLDPIAVTGEDDSDEG